MAYITGNASDVFTSSATSHVLKLPVSSQNDITFLHLSVRNVSTVSSIVGDNGGTWTLVDNTTKSIIDSYLYRCTQGATPDTEVTITFSSSHEMAYGSVNVTEADTTTPIDAYAVANGNSRDPDFPTVTPTNNNSLILLFGGHGAYDMVPEEGVRIEYAAGGGYSRVICGSNYQYTAAATGTYKGHSGGSANYHYVTLTVAVKDDTSGNIKGHHDLNAQAFQYLHLFSHGSGSLSDNTTYDPTDVANENITSISNGSYTNSSTNEFTSYGLGADAVEIGFSSRSFYTSSATYYNYALISGYGITETFGSIDNYDLSNKILAISPKCTAPGMLKSDKIGLAFGLSDKTNARIWQLNTIDTVPNVVGGLYTNLIDVSDTTYVMDSVGTFDPTSVGNILVVGEHRLAYNYEYFSRLLIVETLTIQGGFAAEPSSFETCYSVVEKGLINTVLAQGGLADSQYLVCHNTQCGGTETVYWDSSNQSVEWPSAYDADAKKLNFKIGAGKLTHTIAPIAGSTVIYDSTTLNFGNYHNFVLDSAVGISSDGLNVLNADVVLKNNGSTALSGVSFIGCKEITYTTLVDLSGGNTISNCVDTTAISVSSEADFNKLANCTFTGNNRAITITGNQSGTWTTDPNLTLSGNTYDIEYTGTTDFTIESSGSITVNNASTGTLTIDSPSLSFTVNSDEAGSDIKIFTSGTQTVLASATGTTASYVYTGTPTFDWTVMKAGFLPQRGTGVLMAGSNVTVDVTLVADPVYDSGHGLTYTTDASWSRAGNTLTVPTWGPSARAVHSLLIDSFISQSSLDNTAYNISMNGPNSMFLIEDAEGATDGDIENMTATGVRYVSSADAVTAEWVGIESIGTATGFQGEYQQQDGSGTTDARTTGKFDEVVKVYGDVTHGNFDYRSHLVMKFQPNGYRETRVDVLDTYGISSLEPTHYIVAMEPVAIAAAVGDPAVTLTITDHGATPVTWNSKDFSITITDSGALTGEEIIRELNYNLSLDATYQGKDPFNWPEMVLETGSDYETARGYTEGGTPTDTLKGVRVIRGSDPHPDFTRFQADDGTYYVVPITATASITGIVSGSRVRIYNETTATETYNDVPGTSYSDNYTEGTTYTAGDVVKIYITQTSGVTAQLPYSTTVVAGSTGWTVLAAQESDSVYDQYGLNGSTITKFSADYVNDEVDLTVASNFSAEELYAWWSYNLTTSQGISDFFGGITAEDAANLRINNATVSIYLDNTTASNVYQTDNIRIYRADEAYPVKNPTTGGGGIDVVWRDKVYIAVTGSGVTSQDKTDIKNLVFDEVIENSETFKEQVRLMRAEAAGKLAVSGTTVTIRDAADSKDRITATVDSNGQRTSVTTDAS